MNVSFPTTPTPPTTPSITPSVLPAPKSTQKSATDQSSQGQPSQQQHSDQPTLPAAHRASHSTLKAHSRSARAIDSSASSRTATLSDQALTTSPLTSSIGAVERFSAEFDGQDTDSYDFIKEKTSKMIGDTITSLFVGRSPAEKVQILALIRKNEGITFDLQLSDTDGQDNEYHVRKVYTPKAQDQTPETFIRRSAQEFADDSIRQIRDVENEGAINIRKITLSLELPKIVEANNLQKYPKKILQGLGIVDKSGKTLDPSSMPGWRKLQSTLNNLIPDLKTYGGTGVHLDKESALYQAALKIAAAQEGIPSKETIGKALEQIVKVYHQYVADQLEKQQELLLHGRPHPFSHVADKLGNWLGVQPGQRHKIVSDKVSVAYQERRPITSPFGSGGCGGTLLDSLGRDVTVKFQGNLVALLENEKVRERGTIAETEIKKLADNLGIASSSYATFSSKIKTLFAKDGSGALLNNDALPAELEDVRSGYEKTYKQYQQSAVEQYKDLELKKQTFLYGPLEKNSVADLNVSHKVKNFELLLADRKDADKLHDLVHLKEKQLNLVKQVFSVIPVIGDVVNIGIDTSQGNWDAVGHEALRLGAVALSVIVPALAPAVLAEVAVGAEVLSAAIPSTVTPLLYQAAADSVITGSKLLSASMFLSDAAWKEGESVEAYLKAVKSGDEQAQAAAEKAMIVNGVFFVLTTLPMLHGLNDFNLPENDNLAPEPLPIESAETAVMEETAASTVADDEALAEPTSRATTIEKSKPFFYPPQRVNGQIGYPMGPKKAPKLPGAVPQTGRAAKKTVDLLRQERAQLNTKHQDFLNKQPAMQKKLDIALELLRKDPERFRENFEKIVNEDINFHKEALETIKKLRTSDNIDLYNERAVAVLHNIITGVRRTKPLYDADMNHFTSDVPVKLKQFLINTSTPNVTIELQNFIKNGLNISKECITLQSTEEAYLSELKAIKGIGEKAFDQLTLNRNDKSSTLIKGEEIRFLSVMCVFSQSVTSAINGPELIKDFMDRGNSVGTVVNTYRELINNTSLSLMERLEVLRSIVEQSQKAKMNYDTLRSVYSPHINQDYVNRILEGINDLEQAAENELGQLKRQTETIASISNKNTVKSIFKTKKHGLLIGRLRPKKQASEPEIIEVTDPSSKTTTSYKQESAGDWVSIESNKVPLLQKTENLRNLLQSAKEKLNNSERFISNADYQAKNNLLPAEIEEILLQQAERMKELAKKLQTVAPKTTPPSDAISMAEHLEKKAIEFVEKGRSIRLDMTLKSVPTPGKLEYLNSLGLLEIKKTVSRKRLSDRMVLNPGTKKTMKEPDFLDEFEVKVRGKVWAYAHMHYSAVDTSADYFSKAHLKLPGQKGMTGEGTHYGNFHAPLFRKVFFNEKA